MERRELERMIRSIREQILDLGDLALRSHQVVKEWDELEPAFEGQGLEQIDEFFRLGEELAWVWATHPRGSAIRGELTADKFKDVLDKEAPSPETNNNEPGEEK